MLEQNKTKKPYIGVTGFTTLEDVSVMTDALKGNFGMYGILMSHKTLEYKLKRGRFAALSDVKKLMKKMPDISLRTIHWCDGHWYERNDAWRGIENAINSTEGKCNAIQLNMAYPPVEFFKNLREYGLKTIFQIEVQMFEKPVEMKKKMLPYKDYVDYVIIDRSMGAGIHMKTKESRDIANELKNFDWGIVAAGGLTAQNIVEPEISKFINEFNTSTDSEGNLMNTIDNLDHKKLKDYVAAISNIIRRQL